MNMLPVSLNYYEHVSHVIIASGKSLRRHDLMTVSTEAILRRMEEELNKAKQQTRVDNRTMKERVMKMHMLCELILDQREDELERQLTETTHDNVQNKPSPSLSTGIDGDSIFDF